jgi:hypothetical protein
MQNLGEIFVGDYQTIGKAVENYHYGLNCQKVTIFQK